MGRTRLVCRLALRDLRHRPAQAILVLLAITAASATLTLGLVLRSVTAGPSYQQTRAATRGPDVVATDIPAAQLHATQAQARAAGATVSTPYPVAGVTLRAGAYAAPVTAEGRQTAPAALDQPAVTQGTWIRPGQVVIERSFATALGVGPGGHVTLDGKAFTVAGIAVTAASPPYPQTGFLSHDPALGNDPGLVWVTAADARALATPAQPLTYTLAARANAAQSAKLAGPTGFQGYWTSAQAIAAQDGKELHNEQLVLSAGSWLLGLLAVASVAVLAGGRMSEQTRRSGLIKAVGGTPRLVSAVLLAEYLILAAVAAAAGLLAGRLAAPLLTNVSFFTGLSSAPATPAVSGATIAVVLAAVIVITAVATLVPAVRAARTSTVAALASSARPPRRHAWLLTLSARLPAPLLLGLRVAARRPRRALLNAATTALAVTTLVAVLVYRAHAGTQLPGAPAPGPAAAPPADPVSQVMLVITAVLVVLAAVNAIVIAWATVLDARHLSALARSLGTTPRQLVAGLCAAQLLPALPGAVAGIPAGIGLYAAVSGGGGLAVPPVSWLAAAALGTLLALAVLTAIPARLGARQPIAAILQAEH